MLTRFFHWWRLRKLRRERQRIERAYDADISTAHRAKKKSDEIESIRQTQDWELRNCNDEIAGLETDYYRDLADLYGVAMPPFVVDEYGDGDDWYRPQMYARALLTRQGRARLRSDIRKEKRERREGWLPYISAVTAMLSVIVAGLALLYKH